MVDAATTPSRIPSVQQSPHYQVVLLVLSTLLLGKVIFHHQRFSKLRDLWPLSRNLQRNLVIPRKSWISLMYTNITRIDEVVISSYRTSLLSYAILARKRIFLHVTIPVINMLVVLCTALWFMYFSPSSQLKYSPSLL